MKILIATTEGGTVTVDGVIYEISNGSVTIDNDAHAAQLIESHGFKERGDEDEDPHDVTPKGDQRDLMLGLIDKMDRNQLLVAIQNAGITFEGGRNNVQLRKMLRDRTAAMFDAGKAAVDHVSDDQLLKIDQDAALRAQEEADLKAAADALKREPAPANAEGGEQPSGEKPADENAGGDGGGQPKVD